MGKKDSPNKKSAIKNDIKTEVKADTEANKNEVKSSVSPAKASSFFGKKFYCCSSLLRLVLIQESQRELNLVINSLAPFLYTLKTSENLWFSNVFRGCRNRTLL